MRGIPCLLPSLHRLLNGVTRAQDFYRRQVPVPPSLFSVPPVRRGMRFAAGFSLVELLVVLAISSFMAAGLLYAAGAALRSSHLLREDAFLQGNARFVRTLLARELEQAGYGPCRGLDAPFESMVAAAPQYAWLFGIDPLQGFEQGGNNWPARFADDALPGTDAVLLRGVAGQGETVLTGHSTPQLLVTEASALEAGETALLVDARCRAAVLFQVTDTGRQRLAYESSAAVQPGNCSDCRPPLPWGAFAPGSAVLPYRAVAYFIGASSAGGIPALFRERLVRRQGGLSTRSEEVLQGVENMQLRYAVDTDEDELGIPDRYENAEELAASGSWSRVRGAEVELVLRSRLPVAVALGDGDGYLRRRLNFFVPLPNGTR